MHFYHLRDPTTPRCSHIRTATGDGAIHPCNCAFLGCAPLNDHPATNNLRRTTSHPARAFLKSEFETRTNTTVTHIQKPRCSSQPFSALSRFSPSHPQKLPSTSSATAKSPTVATVSAQQASSARNASAPSSAQPRSSKSAT